MLTLRVCLFGQFSAEVRGQPVPGFTSSKAQELFCYLLLHRERLHLREALAGLLWPETPPHQAKKYLRHTIWQLQVTLQMRGMENGARILKVEHDRVRLNPNGAVWVDVAEFEQSFAWARDGHADPPDAKAMRLLKEAVELYRGDLLEGWYQDWCLYERERLQCAYIKMLEKLLSLCEAQGEYETAASYGARILAVDRTHERTHQRLMRLYYLGGDRASALHQFEHCVKALAEEMDVKPSQSTLALCDQIRSDRLAPPAAAPTPLETPAGARASLPRILGLVHQLRTMLNHFQLDLERELQSAVRLPRRKF